MPYNLPAKSGKPRSLLEAEDYNWERKDWDKDTDEGNVYKGKYYPLYCYMISAKRYVLYNLVTDGTGSTLIIIRKKSDHGLGHLNNPIPGQKGSEWVSDLWKYIIAKEHTFPNQEPEWFYQPAFAQFTASKPALYNTLCRDKEKSWLESIKPFNFGLVAYPKKQKGMFLPVIDPYYCRRQKQFKNGTCPDKSKCLYRMECFSNIHITPIAPFAGNDQWSDWEDFNWLDKTTLDPVSVTLSKSSSPGTIRQFVLKKLKENDFFGVLSLPDYEQEIAIERLVKQWEANALIQERDSKGIVISNYYDMVKDYCEHAEAKYNDEYGNPCRPYTKGLLTRKHLQSKEIRLIGKETNTLQTIEEAETMIDEQLNELSVLHYNKKGNSGHSTQRDYLKPWPEIRKLLKSKAKPREQWAKVLNISARHFKRLLTGDYNPSPTILNKAVNLLKAEGLNISGEPSGNSKQPERGQVYKVKELSRDIGMTEQKIRAVFREWIIRLYGIEYVDLSSDFAQKIVNDWLKQRKTRSEAEKRKAISALKIIGEVWDAKAGSYQPATCGIEDVTHYRVRKQLGRKARRIQVLLQDRRQLILKERPNRYLFKLGLVARPSAIKLYWINNPEVKSTKDGKYFYSPWYEYNGEAITWVDVNKITNNYSISMRTFKMDLASGRFPAASIREEGGRIFVDPLIAWKIYSKGEILR